MPECSSKVKGRFTSLNPCTGAMDQKSKRCDFIMDYTCLIYCYTGNFKTPAVRRSNKLDVRKIFCQLFTTFF